MALLITLLILTTTINNLVVYVSTIQQDDVQCLKSIKASIEDPHNYLRSWQFPNRTSPGFICTFVGIECWNAFDNRVISINLQSLGLKGEFPNGIAKCNSLQLLNLSNNKFYGSIPTNVSFPFIVILSLSSNNFSGEIPANLGNCSYLNVLELDHNQFSGRLPSGIGRLARLRKFSVADNLLVGPIPQFASGIVFNASSYANNTALCGYPLSPCKY